MARSVVLLQVRDEPSAEEQERLCFLESCGLSPQELETINLVKSPKLGKGRVRNADAILIGGAGAHTATRTYSFTPYLEDVVDWIVEQRRPMFASCFGHHFLVNALSGELVTDQDRGEIGTFDIELTETGVRDPLLRGFPRRFPVQLGHHDRVLDVPPQVEELAYSDKCRFQMLRVVDRPIYSTQFHPEMSELHLRARLEMYRNSYLADQAKDEELSFPLRPSIWADKLLRRFLDLCL